MPTGGMSVNGISRVGVKIRTRAAQFGRVDGTTKVVSERFKSFFGDFLHREVFDAGGVRKYRQRIAFESVPGEHIHDTITVLGH